MGFKLNDLGKALTDQIYHTVLGGDEKVPPPKNTFFTWCMPGLPFTEDDLDFCAKGLYSAPTAEEMNKRLSHAYSLAMLLDFIPDVAAPYSSDRQEGMYKPDAEKHLSEIYRQILRFSKVVNTELSAAEKQKLEKFRDLLFTKKKVKDLITDEEKEVTEEGPVLKAYNEKMAAYLTAATEYNAKRIAAAAATGAAGKGAVADWSMNAQLYYLKVKQAADAWISGGYRNEVDQMNAYINQVTQRSMVMWKQQLEETYDKGAVTSTDVPIPFRYTTLVPGNLAKAGGWTGIGVSQDHVKWSKENETSSWNAGAGVSFGLFSIGGGASGERQEYEENREVQSFSLSFELCQAVVVRPWFYPEWFANRGWTLRKGEGWTFSDMPSNGGNPPKGEFIGFATQALFARNISIRSSEFVSAYKSVASKVGGNASVGWGPFTLSGGYRHSKSKENFESDFEAETLRVKGMQIIGFVNHLIGKAPNPLAELKDANFV
jgi:hypothetical protein